MTIPIYSYKFGTDEYEIYARKIAYIYSAHRICCIVDNEGKEYTFYKKLDEVQEELKKIYPVFLRIGKSYLINVNFISSYTRKSVTLSDGTILNISRGYSDNVQRALRNITVRHQIKEFNTRTLTKDDYPEMTAEQYRKKIEETLQIVDNVKALRYFCIFICEKLKNTYTAVGGAAHE